jgi:hypothetical protein
MDSEPRKYTSAELRRALPWWLRHACPLYVTPLAIGALVLLAEGQRLYSALCGIAAVVAAFVFEWRIRGWLIRHGYWGAKPEGGMKGRKSP